MRTDEGQGGHSSRSPSLAGGPAQEAGTIHRFPSGGMQCPTRFQRHAAHQGLHSPKDSPALPFLLSSNGPEVSLPTDQGPVTSPQEASSLPPQPTWCGRPLPLPGFWTHGTSVAVGPTALQLRPGTAHVPCSGLCLHPGPHAAGQPWAGLWLASGFSGTRPAGAALGRAHSPCILLKVSQDGCDQEAPGVQDPR